MFTIAVFDQLRVSRERTPAAPATYAVEVRISASAVGPKQVVMEVGDLRAIVRRVLGLLMERGPDRYRSHPGEAPSRERIAEELAALVAEQIAVLPPDAAPPPPAMLRVRLGEAPESWTSFDRPLLPTPAIR